MKLYISGEIDALKNAGRWFNHTLRTVLDDLEAQVELGEKRWGECSIFVELYAPRTRSGRPSQIDLLLCFDDRIAHCEVKQWAARGIIDYKFRDAVVQIGTQRSALCDLFGGHGLGKASVCSFLWAPHLRLEQIKRAVLQQEALTYGFFHVCGGQPELRHTNTSRGSAYFPAAFMEKLSAVPSARASSGATFRSVLHDAITKDCRRFGIPIPDFPSFSRLREFVATARTDAALIPEASFLAGLRPDALKAAHLSLEDRRFVEIIGPTGIGKTSFIREVVGTCKAVRRDDAPTLAPLVVERMGLGDLLRLIAEQTERFDPTDLPRYRENDLFEQLLREKFVYWIRDYDLASAPAIQRLAGLLTGRAKDGQAYWVLESMVSANRVSDDLAPHQVVLRPLNPAAITAILERHEPSPRRPDIATVIEAAQGVPHTAVLRWTLDFGEELPSSERLDKYPLFFRHLPEDQRCFVAPIAYILREAPLGCTFSLVERWCRTVQPYARSDHRSLVASVIERMREQRFVTVEVLGSAEEVERYLSLGDDELAAQGVAQLAATFLPESIGCAGIGWINIVDPHFGDHFAREITSTQKADWDTLLREALLTETINDYSLTGVTFSLLTGDFEPFVRSSFRTTSPALKRTKSWLEFGQPAIDACSTADQAYFLHWLSWTMDHYWDLPERASEGWIISPPTAGRAVQSLLYDFARARGQFYRASGTTDMEGWAATSAEFRARGDYDLWSDAELRRAQALLRPPYSDVAASWEMMKGVLKEEERLAPGSTQGAMYFHILSFLNSRKRWAGHVLELEDTWISLVHTLAVKMIRAGFAAENINTLANAIFFLVRALESQRTPLTSQEVESYAVLMQLVQRVSPSRRVQAMLTEGSVHRHFITRTEVTWGEFGRHADSAIAVYERAGEAARRAHMSPHYGDSLGYRGAILGRSLRFAHESDFDTWLEGHLPRLVQQTMDALDNTQFHIELAKTSSGRSILTSVLKNYSYQCWIAALYFNLFRADILQRILSVTFEALRGNIAELPHAERIAAYSSALTDWERALTVTEDCPHFVAMRAECRSSISHFLDDAMSRAPVRPDGLRKFKRKEEKIRVLLTD